MPNGCEVKNTKLNFSVLFEESQQGKSAMYLINISICVALLVGFPLARQQIKPLNATQAALLEKTYYFDAGAVPRDTPQKEGYFRKILRITPKNYYLIQDFYQDNQAKFNDPMLINVADIADFDAPTIEGATRLYYPSGKPLLQGQSREGKKEGAWTWWYGNGQKEGEEFYQADSQQGMEKRWYIDGRPALQGKYVDDGRKDGRWVWWYPNGQKHIEESWKHSWRQGPVAMWSEDGKVTVTGQFEFDAFIDKCLIFNEKNRKMFKVEAWEECQLYVLMQ